MDWSVHTNSEWAPGVSADKVLDDTVSIMAMVSRDAPLGAVLDALCLSVEAQLPGTHCSVLLLDDDGQRLQRGAAPHLPAAYTALIDGSPIGPKAGSCGTAAYRGEQVIVSDIATDPLWDDYRELATKFDLKACWSTPIFSAAGEVLGTFAVYPESARAPHAPELQILRQASYLACLVIEHKQVVSCNARMAEILEATPDYVAILNTEGRLIHLNRAWRNLLGEEIAAGNSRHSLGALYPDRVAEKVLEEWIPAAIADDYKCGETLIRGVDGVEVPALQVLIAHRDMNNQVDYLSTIVRDITAQKQAEEQMRLSASVFESSHDAILITDADARILSSNPAFTRITGYSAEEVLGQDPRMFNSGRHGPDFYGKMWQALLTEGFWTGEIWNRRKNGEIYPEWLSISVVRDADNAPANFIAIFSDISERKAADDHIRYLAYYDALTNLPNRALLRERLESALVGAQKHGGHVALIVVDVDRFKNINDSLGHDVGDVLLQHLATRLGTTVGSSDTVARQGGDEFLICLGSVPDVESVALMAEKILAAATAPFAINGQELSITLSIGIAVAPEDGSDGETLLRNADAAMFSAKNLGRNSYRFYTADMNSRVTETLTMENDLRRALEREEFHLVYQPQLNGRTGALVGVEALLRWERPGKGAVQPNRFIPVAEESGLILPIGDWILRTVCRQIRQWRDAGLRDFTVSVNLSALQFRQPGLVTQLTQLLKESGVSPRSLELELTESMIMDHAESTMATMRALVRMGLKLVIDDFGTGYSSLSYLKQFPIQTLKIDQSFVREIPRNKDDMAIASAIINMGKSLQFDVIAEGVETEEQLAFLRAQGCDTVQGYYYAKPMTVEQFEQWLAQRRANSVSV